MDTDFETEQRYRYTVGQFMKLNHGKVNVSQELSGIFSKYIMPDCCKEQPYNNKHNICFYPPGVVVEVKKKQISLRRTDDAYNDSNILSELRHAFSSVVKGHGGTIHAVAKISQILIPVTMIDEVAKLFFDTIIQSPQQMSEYIHVLFSISQPNSLERKIHYAFAKLVMNTFKNPPILKTSPLESGEDRTKRHRSTTCQLMASLFVYDFKPDTVPSHVKPHETFNDVAKLREKVIEPLLEKAKVDQDAIKNLAHVWGILMPKYKSILALYKPELNEIYKDKTFKLTNRITLKDYCID